MADPVWCFSQAVNLRCIGLSHIQRIVLVIPPALSLIAAFYLASLSLHRTQIKNSLIFIEAFVFFGLCIGELAVHDATHSASLATYSVADRAIGVISGIPLVAFATFLPLFIGSAVLPYLHRHWHTASIYIIILAIPVLLVFEELSSLDGLVYSMATPGNISQDYANKSARHMAELFTKITLGVLVVIQLIVSLLCIRLVSHINHIHELGGSIPGISVKASVMFATGTAIGAVDAAFGLVPSPIFATIFFRRIIEALSRLLIIASLISQHFSEVNNSDSITPPMRPAIVNTPTKTSRAMHLRRRSRLLGLIGNPRYSTFAHLQGDNPTAADVSERRRGQRVTVSYDYVNPPVLEVRFSQLGVPQMERAFAYAAASAGMTPSPRPPPLVFSRTNTSSRNAVENGSSGGGANSRPLVSPTISVRANASLYRHRPEYFQSQPQLPTPAHLSQQQEVVRPDSPVFGRGSTVNIASVSGRPASFIAPRTPPRISPPDTLASRQSTGTGLSGEILGGGGESYDTGGILAQFPETPRTNTPSARGILNMSDRNTSRNQLTRRESEDFLPISLSGRDNNTFGRRSSQEHSGNGGENDPFLEMTTPPSDATTPAEEHSGGSDSARIMTVDARATLGSASRLLEPRRPGERNDHRDSFLDFSDVGAPSPFDPHGYATMSSPLPAGNPDVPSTPERYSPEAPAAPPEVGGGPDTSMMMPAEASTTHRRLDMTHQRIPTAELAPLNVFRERLAERRRGRSAHSGSTGASESLSASLSPSPPQIPLAEPRLRTFSRPGAADGLMPVEEDQIAGRGRRDTVASSVASFFLGPSMDGTNALNPPAMPEQSRWSETNDSSAALERDQDDNESVLIPPSMGALSRVDSERTTPSPTTVPSEVESAEQRGSVVYGVAR